jgi:hypothetical protein
MYGFPIVKEVKVATIVKGEMFGECNLCFNIDNPYTVRVKYNLNSKKLKCLKVSYNDLRREYKRLIPALSDYLVKKY